MRPPSLTRLLVVLVLVTGGAALAQRRQLQNFETQEMTQEERDALRSRPKYNINSYGKDIQIKEEPIPWKAIGLGVIAMLVAAPFAYRAYRGTTKEMAEANVFGVSSARAGEAEDEQQ
ncbi:hypothetical protein [Archangium lansingense]|uniref:Uncharacterized protein n=1 Tax=Archangium lansingense TaxID=2995310 RepID=A0ABT4A966_9BACT|nr:hypothetical protein [Archangium lansinium]MCY1078193.1 hypothetical protein [Archangium lansinium]